MTHAPRPRDRSDDGERAPDASIRASAIEASPVVAKRDYDYFDHDADMGVVGRGAAPEAAFEAAAQATFALMVDLTAVRPRVPLRFEFEEEDLELALATWLNRLLAEARAAGLALGRFHLRREGARWTGEAWGEPWRDDLDRGVEVKGATLTMLSARPAPGGWEARCVVDV